MSRRLDALFAERVLGEVRTDPGVRCPSDINRLSPGGCWVCYSDPWEPGDWRPMKYTQSLDAAWLGVEKVGNWAYVDFDHLSACNEWMCNGAQGVTPAAALVRACLLAVGVSQEEIDDGPIDF